jgi:hypothetical protein
MNTWKISIVVDWGIPSRRHGFVRTLNRRGFSVKLSNSQPDMYRSVGPRFCYSVSHEHARALTLFLLAFDAHGMDMRITAL